MLSVLIYIDYISWVRLIKFVRLGKLSLLDHASWVRLDKLD